MMMCASLRYSWEKDTHTCAASQHQNWFEKLIVVFLWRQQPSKKMVMHRCWQVVFNVCVTYYCFQSQSRWWCTWRCVVYHMLYFVFLYNSGDPVQQTLWDSSQVAKTFLLKWFLGQQAMRSRHPHVCWVVSKVYRT